MLKRFLQIKKQYRYIGGVVLLAIVGLLLILLLGNTPITETILVPVGETTFSIPLDIDEATPYAGIEFALALSNENTAQFTSFTPGLDGAVASPFAEKDGLYYCGFYAASYDGSNAFPAGETTAGLLNFEGYTGDETLTVTVMQMNVIRLDENNQSVTTEKASPVYTFTVQREGGN